VPRYSYIVRDYAGKNAAGVVTADNADDASAMLRRDGMTIISLTEERSSGGAPPAPGARPAAGGRKRIKRDEVIFFTTQLAVMVDTGVPLDEALDLIAGQIENIAFAKIIHDICEEVKSGTEFSSALEQHPRIFDSLFVSLMKASEISGTMGQMLQRASEYMEQQRETRKRIKGAMTYPVCMLSFCALVVIGLLVFILPRFEKIYKGKGAILPLPTRMLMGMSQGILDYWPFIFGGLAVVAGALIYYLRTPGGKIAADKFRLNLPLIGSMFRKACLARSLRTMATMVGTGVGILDGLEITAAVAGNSQYSRIWLAVADGVREGQPLSQGLMECNLIPRTITQMVDAGERTGKLAMVMNRVAKFCEDDLAVAVKTITSMIEPIMIITMGLIVGGIAMAMLLPIFKLSRVVAH